MWTASNYTHYSSASEGKLRWRSTRIAASILAMTSTTWAKPSCGRLFVNCRPFRKHPICISAVQVVCAICLHPIDLSLNSGLYMSAVFQWGHFRKHNDKSQLSSGRLKMVAAINSHYSRTTRTIWVKKATYTVLENRMEQKFSSDDKKKDGHFMREENIWECIRRYWEREEVSGSVLQGRVFGEY